MARKSINSERCVFGDCDSAIKKLIDERNVETMEVNGIFDELEIKAILQVCRDLDLVRVTEAARSKAFNSARRKFQHMAEHAASGKIVKERVCMICGFSNQCMTCVLKCQRDD